MAQSTQWGHAKHSQFTYLFVSLFDLGVGVGGLNSQPPDDQRDAHLNEPPRPAQYPDKHSLFHFSVNTYVNA